MKKNFKRKNYVLIGAIGIAAVALTSVGFATWITGMQNLTAPADVTNIVVDTAVNDTLYLDVALSESDNSISLKQKTVDNGKGKLSAADNAEDTDLSITFSKFSVYASSKYKADTIKVTMGVTVEGSDLVYTNNGIAKGAEEKTYITLPAALTGESVTLINGSSIDGYTVKTLENKTMKFTWGSLFQGKDPITYYNGKIGTETSPEVVLPIMNEATSTLNEMNEKLNGKTIKLTFTVTATPVSAQQ